MSVGILISRGDQQYGPYSLDELRGHIEEGLVSPDDLACVAGNEAGWRPLRELVEIEFAETPAPALIPPPSMAPPPLPPEPASAPSPLPSAPPSSPSPAAPSGTRFPPALVIGLGCAAAVAVPLVAVLLLVGLASLGGGSAGGGSAFSDWSYEHAIDLLLKEDPSAASYILERYQGVYTHTGSHVAVRVVIPADPTGMIVVRSEWPGAPSRNMNQFYRVDEVNFLVLRDAEVPSIRINLPNKMIPSALASLTLQPNGRVVYSSVSMLLNNVRLDRSD